MPVGDSGPAQPASSGGGPSAQPVPTAAFQPPVLVFQPPEIGSQPAEQARPRQDGGADEDAGGVSRRRRRGGRGRGKGGAGGEAGAQGNGQDGGGQGSGGQAAVAQKEDRQARGADDEAQEARAQDGGDGAGDENDDGSPSSRRRRRRRQRGGAVVPGGEVPADDPADTVVHVREPRPATEPDDVRAVKGSTRLEAKRQRRREGRDTGRRRPPVITESEFLARREAVERVMAVRQQGDRTQIAVLEDGVLVEHYVDRASHQSYVGNVYLGKVQNVLPSMEAAFVDIGKGRNAV
ncbi:MAG TPA: ribonuclease E/G, partial [Streptosporangiaceae bacterium]